MSAVHQRPLLFSIVSSSLLICSLCALVDCEGRRRFPINVCILSAGFVPVVAIIVTVTRSHAESIERLKERYERQVSAQKVSSDFAFPSTADQKLNKGLFKCMQTHRCRLLRVRTRGIIQWQAERF